MKRRALLGHLQEHGCAPVREGGNHSIWSNPKTGRKEAVPRHNEIKKHLAPLNLPQPLRADSTRCLKIGILARDFEHRSPTCRALNLFPLSDFN